MFTYFALAPKLSYRKSTYH